MKLAPAALKASTALAALAFTLTACGSPAPEAAQPSTPEPMVAEASTSEDEAQEEAPEAAEEGMPQDEIESDTLKSFGETAKLTDIGAEVTVKYLGPAKATDTSTSGVADATEFSVTIENVGNEVINGYDVIFEGLYAGEDGMPSEEIYDMDNGWSGPDYSAITPGRKQTVKTAFEAPEPGLVQFMLSVGWSDTIVFEGDLSD